MVYRGTIRNRHIQLEDGLDLRDGTPVRFELIEEPDTTEPADDPLLDIARRAVPIGQSDLARNHDHYLHGHPKR